MLLLMTGFRSRSQIVGLQYRVAKRQEKIGLSKGRHAEIASKGTCLIAANVGSGIGPSGSTRLMPRRLRLLSLAFKSS